MNDEEAQVLEDGPWWHSGLRKETKPRYLRCLRLEDFTLNPQVLGTNSSDLLGNWNRAHRGHSGNPCWTSCLRVASLDLPCLTLCWDRTDFVPGGQLPHTVSVPDDGGSSSQGVERASNREVGSGEKQPACQHHLPRPQVTPRWVKRYWWAPRAGVHWRVGRLLFLSGCHLLLSPSVLTSPLCRPKLVISQLCLPV